MTRTKKGTRLRVSIEIKDEDGDVVEVSHPDDPVEMEIGDGTLPPTVDEALIGHVVGDVIEVTCPEGEAFGDPSPEAIVSVPREDFPDDVKLEKGEMVAINVEDEDGGALELEAIITEVNPDGVILDANHPLAGLPATFRVTIEAVL